MGSLFSPQVKTVGGSSASTTGNQFQSFLQQLLGGSGVNPLSGMGSGSGPGLANALKAMMNNMGQGNPASPGGGPFGNVVSAMLGNNPTGIIANNPFLQQFQSMGQGMGSGMATLPGQPNFQGTNFTPLNTTIHGSQTYNQMFPGGTGGMTQGMNGGQIKDFISQYLSGPNGGMGSLPGRVGPAGPLNAPGMPGSPGFDASGGKLLNYDTNSPEFQAISDSMNRDLQRALGDTRARFGGTGNAFSTGASSAESQLYADVLPKMALAKGALGREMQGMDLSQQGLNNQLRLGMTGANVSDIGNRLGAQSSQYGTLANYLTGNRGLDVGQRGQDIDFGQMAGNLGLGAANLAGNMFGQGQNNFTNQLGIGAGLLSTDAQNYLQSMGLNNNAIQAMNQNMFANNSSMNNFNQNMFGMNSNNALQNQGMGNQMSQFLMSQLGNMGINLSQLAQSGQLGILGQIFGSMNQASGQGLPQAQTAMSPSPFSQIAGLGGSIASMMGGGIPGIPGMGGGSQGGFWPQGGGGGFNQSGGFGIGSPGGYQPGGIFPGGQNPFRPGGGGGMNPQIATLMQMLQGYRPGSGGQGFFPPSQGMGGLEFMGGNPGGSFNPSVLFGPQGNMPFPGFQPGSGSPMGSPSPFMGGPFMMGAQ